MRTTTQPKPNFLVKIMRRITSHATETGNAMLPLSQELDELLSRRLRHLVLPEHILDMYNKRTARGNRFMMSSWAIGVASSSFVLAFFDIFLVPKSQIMDVLEIRAYITIIFLLAAQLLKNERFLTHTSLLVMTPCLTTLALACLMGVITGSPVLFLIYLFLMPRDNQHENARQSG